jgi:hypothetical protein
MLTLALRLALIALWYPVMLIVVFLLWHALSCSLYGGLDS